MTVGGKKIKRTVSGITPLGGLRTAVAAVTGGQKVFYFKDETGKSVIYTPAEATKATFIEPPAGQQAPEEAPVIADETGGGLPPVLETATGADMSGREGDDKEWQDYKAQVSSVQDSIDLYLQEDRLRQELEENE